MTLMEVDEGTVLISPSGKRWTCIEIFRGSMHRYRFRSDAGATRQMYYREFANWKKEPK